MGINQIGHCIDEFKSQTQVRVTNVDVEVSNISSKL